MVLSTPAGEADEHYPCFETPHVSRKPNRVAHAADLPATRRWREMTKGAPDFGSPANKTRRKRSLPAGASDCAMMQHTAAQTSSRLSDLRHAARGSALNFCIQQLHDTLHTACKLYRVFGPQRNGARARAKTVPSKTRSQARQRGPESPLRARELDERCACRSLS